MWNKLLCAALIWVTLVPALAEEHRLFILHTNDIHGHIQAYPRGGMVRVAAAIQLLRQTFPGEVVLLDAGDTSLGTPLSGLSHGKPTAEIYDLLHYDAVALGNHEFNWGKEVMKTLTDGFHTAVLCANLVTDDGSPPPYPAYTTVERNGVKLGIIGLVTPDTARAAPVAATEGWHFLQPSEAVRAALPTLPKDCDVVLTLDHIGVKADHELARAVPDIDVIIGGHSHTPLQEVQYEGKVPIVQAGCYGEYLGVLELMVDTDLNKTRVVSYRLLRFDNQSPVLPAAQAIVDRYAKALRPMLEKVMAEVTEKLSKRPAKSGYDTPLGNFISDVFRRQAGTDIAVYNRGGVRFDMEKGPLTVETVHKLFPFDDSVTVLEVTGSQLRAVVEQGTVGGEGPLSASGLTAEISDGKVQTILIHGKPLQDHKLYTLATTGFLSDGGDGMSTLAALPKKKRLPYTRDVLLEYLETHSRIDNPGVGRLKMAP